MAPLLETPQRSTIAKLGLSALIRTFNLVYEGYLMPAIVDDEWIKLHLHLNDIDPEHSPRMRSSSTEDVTGLRLLGVRGDRSWVSGFGIAPG